MEWIKDYWYVILLGLVAAMYLFGHKGKGQHHQMHGTDNKGDQGKTAHKSGHGCCG